MKTPRYPRTYHLEGSLGRSGEETVSLSELPGDRVVVEEKLDGSQVSLYFVGPGQIVFQSRGTILSGGPQESEFTRLKAWAYEHLETLWQRLGQRYMMFGEWLYAKHTVFYDALPHYFLEFDIWDNEQTYWLSTEKRRLLLTDSPVISVPILYEGPIAEMSSLDDLLQPSLYKTPDWRKHLHQVALHAGADPARVLAETEPSLYPEGLYIKAETATATVGRYKYIRPDFLQYILASNSHWRTRTLIANQLKGSA